MDAKVLEQDGIKFASSAIGLDQSGHYEEAIFFYKEATQALMHAAVCGSNLDCLSKINEYNQRINTLKELKNEKERDKRASNLDLKEQRAKFLVQQALQEDEAGNEESASNMYLEAAELCLKTIGEGSATTAMKTQLEKLAKQSLDRAEQVKMKQKLDSLKIPSNLPKLPNPKTTQSTHKQKPISLSTSSVSIPQSNNYSDSVADSSSSSGDKLTHEEINVLRKTSSINGRDYLPFIKADLREKFAFPVPFTDKHGLLQLSQKQKSRLGGWRRPSEIMSDPKMILAVSMNSVKQTVVSDCSFVASLAISAAYERKYQKQLITSIIYPQDKHGHPVYNPCGKYMVKLHLNGVSRKVVIDDQLPVDRHGELLCSYSNNANELWVSLVEKAYMKVMGGYDFPGSNSNIDMHALTGWIPERQSLRLKSFDYNKFFANMCNRLSHGDCLATISTGQISEQEADRAGLVPTHAYAILDMKLVQGIKFLKLKNPWRHLRWKGKFSEKDDKNWTPSLLKELNYNKEQAQKLDDGVFWIDWDSATHFYDTIYVSWKPALFRKTKCYHEEWLAGGPRKDSYSLGDNPQYKLEVKSKTPTSVWILLTRHITDKDDFAENKEYITLLVYKNDGKRVYQTYSPPPFIDGVRINSPHYLTRIQVPSSERYTLVVSQYENDSTIRFSLRVYTNAEFKFSKIVDPYKLKKRIEGKWTAATAGGCTNNKSTYHNNPTYQLNIPDSIEKCQLLLELRAFKEYSNGFDIVCVETNAEKPFQKMSSGPFRSGYSVLEISLPHGIYNIIPCTFLPQQIGSFFLDIKSSNPSIKITLLKK